MATATRQGLRPLEEFYVAERWPMPSITLLDGDAVPQPYNNLLVHQQDMTPTLEEYHHCPMGLRVIKWLNVGESVLRMVSLIRQRDGAPAEFGAIKIEVNGFPPEGQKMILEGKKPFGTILRELKMPHKGNPLGFFKVESDAHINAALGLTFKHTLYGRLNVLQDEHGHILAEIVEVLPPA
jgi:hypothetical protein